MGLRTKKQPCPKTATAREIREYYMANIPKGLFREDFINMDDEEIMQFHYVRNESFDDIFADAVEMQFYAPRKRK